MWYRSARNTTSGGMELKLMELGEDLGFVFWGQTDGPSCGKPAVVFFFGGLLFDSVSERCTAFKVFGCSARSSWVVKRWVFPKCQAFFFKWTTDHHFSGASWRRVSGEFSYRFGPRFLLHTAHGASQDNTNSWVLAGTRFFGVCSSSHVLWCQTAQTQPPHREDRLPSSQRKQSSSKLIYVHYFFFPHVLKFG